LFSRETFLLTWNRGVHHHGTCLEQAESQTSVGRKWNHSPEGRSRSSSWETTQILFTEHH